jgi:Nucleotidyl transferase AbiEii toxin, Type IV TA system
LTLISFYSSADDLREAEDALRSAAARDMGDQFRFTIGPGRLIAQAGRTVRVPVVAFVGASEFASFRVDLVAGLTMTGVPEQVPPIVPIDLPGLLRTPYRAYPVVDHIADKVCALLEVHQRSGHSQVASTRYRDLFDLVVFAHTATVDAQSLAAALHSEAVRRSLALPDRLTKPRGSRWAAGYARVARETPQLAERDLDAASVTAGRLIDPVLMGGIAGRWDPGVLAWR